MFIKSPVLCCGENITFHQVAKFSVPLQSAADERLRITDGTVQYAPAARLPLRFSAIGSCGPF
ncbi:hypothetical protein C9011_19085 [Escherichia coli]|nr:hypothetical protein AW091_24405 [Escherichia coli]TJO02841.1 hypothetical protein C9011_19085 [Escherichia coli]